MSAPRGNLAGARYGIAALEFALIAPMFSILIAGTFDLAKGVILWAQVQNTAHLVATSATNVSVVNPDKSTTLSANAAQQSMSVIFAEMPWLRNMAEHGAASVTLTSVEFQPGNASCTQVTGTNCYIANVAWSAAYLGGRSPNVASFTSNAKLRVCGTPLLQIVPGAAIPYPLTIYNVLPTANVTQPDAIMVADVKYQYTPLFARFVTGTLTFTATYYSSVRIGAANIQPGEQYTTYSGSAAANVATGTCPGLPSPTAS